MFSDDAWSNQRKWYESEDQYVRRQRAESEQQAAESEARLRSSLRQVAEQKEVLARQVADLTAAFDAFVELASVREALARYGAAAAAREQARAVLAGLRWSSPQDSPTSPASLASSAGSPATERSPGPDTAAVPGYWLPRAASGLDALVRGDRQAGDEALAAAAESDEQRTALFLALALPLVGKADLAAPWLSRALGSSPSSPETEIAAAVREVWRQAGRGGYGETGRAAAVQWLAGTHSPATAEKFGVLIGKRPVGAGAAEDLSARLGRALAALDALAELRRRFSAEPPSASAANAAVPTDLAETAVGPSFTLLEELVAEGSPAEMELILRAQLLAAEVRRRRTHEEVEPAPRWNTPAGTVLALLEADLKDGSADHTGLRAVAQAAMRRTAVDLAEQLLADTSPELPPSFTLQLDGRRLEIVVDEPLDPQMGELDAAVERRYAPEPGRAGRKHAAETALKIAERKEKNRRDAEAALGRFGELRDKLFEARKTAQQQYDELLDHLGKLAESEFTP
jgi:hypothetical protein